MENKITIADKYNEIIAMCGENELSDGTTVEEFLKDRIAKGAKKSASKKKADPLTVSAREALLALPIDTKGTATQFVTMLDMDGLSGQRVSRILNDLEGKGFTKSKDGKSSIFTRTEVMTEE